MREGRFREDLYYRLCSDVIVAPSLHERIADSPEELSTLALFLAQRLVGDDEAPALAREVEAWVERALGRDYPWPGNVRELAQCVSNVLIRREYRPAAAGGAGATRDELAREFAAGDLPAEEILRRYCTPVYAPSGSYLEAARRLGLDRRTVKRRVDGDLLAELQAMTARETASTPPRDPLRAVNRPGKARGIAIASVGYRVLKIGGSRHVGRQPWRPARLQYSRGSHWQDESGRLRRSRRWTGESGPCHSRIEPALSSECSRRGRTMAHRRTGDSMGRSCRLSSRLSVFAVRSRMPRLGAPCRRWKTGSCGVGIQLPGETVELSRHEQGARPRSARWRPVVLRRKHVTIVYWYLVEVDSTGDRPVAVTKRPLPVLPKPQTA